MNSANKQDKQYKSVFSESTLRKAGHKTSKGISKNKWRKNRKNTSGKRRAAKERELNEKFLRNLSAHQLKLWPPKLYHAQNMSDLDYFHRLFPIRITAWFCYSYT